MSLTFTARVLNACRSVGLAGMAVKPMGNDRSHRTKQELGQGRDEQPQWVDCFGLTDIGRVRARNEDQFVVADLTQTGDNCVAISSLAEEATGPDSCSANLLLVADGVGGNLGGELASRLAAEGVIEYLHANRARLHGAGSGCDDRVLDVLSRALAWAQQRIQRGAEQSPEQASMGTTLTLAYVAWPLAYLAHVGDSRAYLCREHELVQLTHDQTVAQMLADAGAIRADEVARHPYRNVLSSVLSCDGSQYSAWVGVSELAPGDQLLLCTDGLTKHLAAQAIMAALNATSSAADACHELVSAANLAGGTDNVTVALARYGQSAADRVEQVATRAVPQFAF